jgi:DeoR/GlpR family transcriptional regulator of sugar metabolism
MTGPRPLRGSADASMVQQATEVYVLADHTKIGRVSLVTVMELDKVSGDGRR